STTFSRQRAAYLGDLPSSPYTTLFRSKDAAEILKLQLTEAGDMLARAWEHVNRQLATTVLVIEACLRLRRPGHDARHHLPGRDRSEEHTSELQSLTNLVCRLLLEQKNT